MTRQNYPLLLTIAIALAIGVYLQPAEARKCLQLAGGWGKEVVEDILRAAAAIAAENARGSEAGYAAAVAPPATAPPPGYEPWATGTGNQGSSAAAWSPQVNSQYGWGQQPPTPHSPASPVPPDMVFAEDDGASIPASPPPPRVLALQGYPASPAHAGDSYYPVRESGLPGTYQAEGLYPQQQTGNPLRPSMPREAPWAAEQPGQTLPSPHAASPAQQQYPPPQYGSVYPRVQWAGDWRDFQGVPEDVKPMGQPQWGYLPPPAVEATRAAVEEILPPQSMGPAAPYPADQPAYPTAQPTGPAPPFGQPGRAPSEPFGQPPTSAMLASPAATPAQPPTPAGAAIEAPDPVADLTLCRGSQILARVGSEVILGSDVFPTINEKLSTVKGIEDLSADQLQMQREILVRQLLQNQIELKLIYVDAKRALPAEAIDGINKQLSKRFEEVEVTNRLKELQLGSRRELEERLRQWDTSLEREKRAFVEKAIAQQWVFEALRKEGETVDHERLLEYYQAHAAEYEHPTRVRWEHLEVKFSRHPDKREAWQLIAAMGNEVIQGRPFADVARERSEGATAAKGGQRDWITQGSLRSTVLDRALFSLPEGRLSQIIEDEDGFHIIRVVERQDAYRTPFEECQAEIRETLLNEKKETRLKELVQRLREEIPVWTIFDEKTADGRGRGRELY